MFKPVALFIGLRYTRAKRRNHFISFISLVSMIGMALGVMVMITVLSVMNGFDRELRQRILGMVPHATVSGLGVMQDWQAIDAEVEKHPEVVAAAPYVNAQAMLTSGGTVRGVMVNGVEPEQELDVSIIADHMTEGRLEDLESGKFGIVLGDLLAAYLRVEVGDKVTMVLPEASLSPAGVLPRLKRFTVTGIFKVGAELDSSIAYIHIEDAAKIKRMPNGVEGLRLKLYDLFKAPSVAWELSRSTEGLYHSSNWTRTHGNLFSAIKMEKRMIGLLLIFIIAVAAFNIISSLVMLVTDKQSDVAILRTLGASRKTIMGIFMVQGSIIGVVGTLTGTALGVTLALTITDIIAWVEKIFGIQFLSADVYFISYLPSQLLMSDVTVICGSALVMSFLATIYPAYRASQIEPADALRYE